MEILNKRLFTSGGAPLEYYESAAKADVYKYKLLGLLIICVSCWGFIAAFYAGWVLTSFWPISLVIALIWGITIFNIDRMLVMQLTGINSKSKYFFGIFIRLILAISLGYIISHPIKIYIFTDIIKIAEANVKKELINLQIDEEYKTTKELVQKLQEDRSNMMLKNSQIKSKIERESQSRIKRIKGEIRDINNKITQQLKNVTTYKDNIKAAQDIVFCEVLTKKKKKVECNFSKSEIEALQKRAGVTVTGVFDDEGDCGPRCKAAQKQIRDYKSEISKIESEIKSNNNRSKKLQGILDREDLNISGSDIKLSDGHIKSIKENYGIFKKVIKNSAGKYLAKTDYLHKALYGNNTIALKDSRQTYQVASIAISLVIILFEIFPILMKVMWGRNSLDKLLEQDYYNSVEDEEAKIAQQKEDQKTSLLFNNDSRNALFGALETLNQSFIDDIKKCETPEALQLKFQEYLDRRKSMYEMTTFNEKSANEK